jgi:hypothetical protein
VEFLNPYFGHMLGNSPKFEMPNKSLGMGMGTFEIH